MRFRNLEVNYLIALLASTINKRTTPNPLRAIDWRELYYLAEYHGITNISYYSLIGLYDVIPEIWKARFSKVFRKWVSLHATQEKELEVVLEELEDDKIDYMLSPDWLMKRYYPQAEMRIVEDIRILIRPKQEKQIKAAMRGLGYRCQEIEDGTSLSFYRHANFSIIFTQKLFEDNPKLAAYYQKPWKKLKSAVGYGCRYAFSPEDHYIYMVAGICNDYAAAETDARQIIDLFLYLKKHKETLDLDYVKQELAKLELDRMCKCLEDVGDMWLGVYEGKEAGDSRDVEEYIWSKGSYGRETSVKIMPMMVDLELWRVREARKKKMIKGIRWIFPKASHLKNRFPSVEKRLVLLPFYWILRWLTIGGFSLKLILIKGKRLISKGLYEKIHKKKLADGTPKDD